MTPGDSLPSKRIVHEHTWQTLIEFSLPTEPGSERLAADRVAEAVQALNWPATLQERLKLALVKFTWKVVERSRLDGSEAPLIVRVLISEGREVTPGSGQASSEPPGFQEAERQPGQVSRPLSRGWGFFMVQKQADTPPASAGESSHLIELFLYQERERPRK